MPARIWMPLPDVDFEPTEAASPWLALTRAGHRVVITTESGNTPQADPKLLTGVLFGRMGASEEAKARYAQMAQSPEFKSPLPWKSVDPTSFDGLVLPGGHAPGMRQYLGSEELQKKVAEFWKLGRPVGAICHGVLVLARARDASTGRSLLFERRTTCLVRYMELVAYYTTAWKLGRYYRTYPQTVEDEVRAALKDPDRQFERGPFVLKDPSRFKDERKAFVVEDGHYLSGRWPGDASLFAEKFAALVDARLKVAA